MAESFASVTSPVRRRNLPVQNIKQRPVFYKVIAARGRITHIDHVFGNMRVLCRERVIFQKVPFRFVFTRKKLFRAARKISVAQPACALARGTVGQKIQCVLTERRKRRGDNSASFRSPAKEISLPQVLSYATMPAPCTSIFPARTRILRYCAAYGSKLINFCLPARTFNRT